MLSDGVPSLPSLMVVVLALGALAGCVGPDGTPDPAAHLPGFVDPMAAPDGHDHADYAQHQLSWNMQEMGWTDVVPGAPVAWGEADTHEGLAVVAHAWPTAGLATVDITDPTTPTLLDHYDTGVGYGADVKLSSDGTIAVLSVQAHAEFAGQNDPTGGPDLLSAEDPLAGATAMGLHLYDVSDPTEITFLSSVPVYPYGIHMAYVHEIAGEEYVFAVHNLEGIGVWRLVREPTVHLEFVTDVLRPDGPDGPGVNGPHDVTVLDDPALGAPLLYVADAYHGLIVYDVSDPAMPETLGTWVNDDNRWYAHTVQAEVLDDGTRRIVMVPEVFSDAEATLVSPLWILDGTDLSAITLQATWNAPGDHGAEELRYSVHNLQLVGGTIVLAHYHGGVWVLDVATDPDGTTNVTALGYHLPANDPGRPMSGIYEGVYHMMDAPTVWDVVVDNGIVWATDVNSGLYALRAPGLGPNATSLG